MWQWIQEGQIWSEVFLQLPVSHCICHPDGNLFQRDGKTLIYTTFRGLWFSFEVTWELAQFKAKAIFPQNVWQTRELLISLNLLKGTLTLHEYHLLLLSCRFKEQEFAGQKSWDVVHVQAESSAEGNRLQGNQVAGEEKEQCPMGDSRRPAPWREPAQEVGSWRALTEISFVQILKFQYMQGLLQK